jgi:hypothetical protein
MGVGGDLSKSELSRVIAGPLLKPRLVIFSRLK